ncbi:dipeptide ABC transporter ATP-binding protein [Gluconacetobacter diazotrophicus]|uniref:dipeptide ABC transporter ATP-binding protein n=1 Tax=Gluconacetobacter diazotrophicus TaxID=33996 RepID=UPI0011A30B09|nr:ABC transporter ATP-binding protein [Gluconacetobacter diazotrophicus]
MSPIPMNTVLEVEDLRIAYHGKTVVHGVSFQAARGETTALIGESGSGKSTIARAIIGLMPRSARLESGAIRLLGDTLTGRPPRTLDAMRGRRIGFVPQDPSNSLDPVATIGAHIGEMFRLHTALPRGEIRERVLALLERVGLSDPVLRYGQYPHELSGGMRQRVLIAAAVALNPDLIVADEPTSALDVTVQRQILDLLDSLRAEHGTSILLITHDLAIAKDRARATVVLKDGRIAEGGDTPALFAAPRSEYTKRLMADLPVFARRPAPPAPPPTDTAIAVQVSGLSVSYPAGRHPARLAVDSVSFGVRAGTTHAIVGESGSGKTTILRCLTGRLAPRSGTILIEGQDIAHARGPARRAMLRHVQLVYQNPWASLDPRQSVRDIIAEPLRNFAIGAPAGRRAHAAAMLDRVHLPRTLLDRRPAELSGGQCQRVALARALVIAPRILVLDEVVSALDVTVQARILDLLVELRKDLGLTYVFVSHDLAVVRQIADTVSVIRHGRQVESGPAETVFGAPSDAYTKILIAAIPGQGNAASLHLQET